ncbi:MAG: hypothetical protein WA885_13420 [Phormidesmis sp.]
MINTIVAFICGALAGALAGSIAYRAYAKSHWTRRVREVKESLYDQYKENSQIEAQRRRQLELRVRDLLAKGDALTEEGETLTKQLAGEKRDRLHMQANFAKMLKEAQANGQKIQNDYEERLNTERGDRVKLQTEYEHYKKEAEANIDLALKQDIAIEASNRQLKAEVSRLRSEKENLQLEFQTEKEQFDQALKTACEDPDIDFGKIISELFPSLELLRDSIDEINRNKRDVSAILRRLQALNNKNFEYSKKVHSTGGDWSECRAPHMKMIRLYYRKESASPRHKCEVLVSRKKDKKTQEKDLAWIRQQPKQRSRQLQ